jgi:hAT family C-terminal dimerisation region
MPSRLLRTMKKLEKYAAKLDDSPYYLAARIPDPECRTSFLKNKNNGTITLEGSKKLYVVRKLWERFRDKTLVQASYETTKSSESTLESIEQLSAFHKARRQHIEEQTRPQSQDEFDNYINENPIPLDNRTTSLQWWNLPLQRTRFPRLSQLAMEVLSIPGMSDKPERVFSGSRRRIPWDRTRTSPRILEETECLKDWADHGILKILL